MGRTQCLTPSTAYPPASSTVMQPRGMSTVNAPLENLGAAAAHIGRVWLKAQRHCSTFGRGAGIPPVQLCVKGQPGVGEQAQAVDRPLEAVGTVIVGLQALCTIMVPCKYMRLPSAAGHRAIIPERCIWHTDSRLTCSGTQNPANCSPSAPCLHPPAAPPQHSTHQQHIPPD